MAKVISISRVCDKQQGTFNNQGISIHGKLWKRVKNGWEFEKKRKDRKNSGIYRKNEKDVGRSWGSINEGTRRNKEANG